MNGQTQKTENAPTISDSLLMESGFQNESSPNPLEKTHSDTESKNDNNSSQASTPTDKTTPNNPAPENTNPAPESTTTVNPAEKSNEGGEDEDALLERLLKKRNLSLDKLKNEEPAPQPTEEEKQTQLEEKRQKAIQFGITNNIFSQKEYDEYTRTSSLNKEDLVRQEFVAKAIAKNPNLSEEDAIEAFEEKYFIHEDEEGTKYQIGQEDIAEEFNNILEKKYGKILKVTDTFDSVESSLKKATSFRSQVTEIFEKQLPQEFVFKIDGEEVKFPVSQLKESLTTIQKDYLTIETMEALLDQTGKVNADALLIEVQKDLFWNNREAIFSEMAKSYADKMVIQHKAGRKGIVQPDTASPSSGGSTLAQGIKSLSDDLMEGTE